MLACLWYSSQRKQVYYITYINTYIYRNYEEARKAYMNALKYDPQNQNVLRDLG